MAGLNILASVAYDATEQSWDKFSDMAQEGVTNEKNGNYSAAIRCYKEADKLCPKDRPDGYCGLLYQIGRMFLNIKEWVRAIPYLRKALVIWDSIPKDITECLEDRGCHKTLLHYTLGMALSRANSTDALQQP